MKKLIAVSTLLAVIIISCSKSGTTSNGGGTGGGTTVDCSTVTNKAFAADVAPIFSSSCAIASCHATGSANGPGALTTYQQILNNRIAIRAAVASGRMPQTGSLSTSQKNSLLCWIDGGAPNN